MTPNVIERPATVLAGKRVVGKPKQLGKLVPQAWKELRGRLSGIPGVVDASRQYGFLVAGDHKLALGRLATYIGVEVTAEAEIPDDLRRHELPAGRYAEFEYVGSFLAKEFGAFYPSVFGALEENGLKHAAEYGWVELYEDASHDWEDKTKATNRLRVLFPLTEE